MQAPCPGGLVYLLQAALRMRLQFGFGRNLLRTCIGNGLLGGLADGRQCR
jgi:hypothetical protein